MLGTLTSLAVLAVVASPQSDDGFVVRSGVELVRLDAVVLDGETPVSGLTVDDFIVEDEGKPQRILSFEPVIVRQESSASIMGLPTPTVAPPSISSLPEAEEGRHLLIFFDDIHVSTVSAEFVRRQLGPYLLNELRDGDVVTLVAPQTGLWWTARNPYEYAQLETVLAGLGGHLVRDPFINASRRDRSVTEWEAMARVERISEGPLPITNLLPGADQTGAGPTLGMGIFGDSGSKRTLLHEEVYARAQDRIQRTLTVLERAVAALEGFRGHKSLVLFSEGFILSPNLKDRYDGAIDAALRARVAVHLVDPQGPTSGGKDASYGGPTELAGHEGVRRELQVAGTMHVVSSTGGQEFVGIVKGVRQALVGSSNYYLIGYQMPDGDKTERQVKVRVKRDGFRVLAPQRYFTQPRAQPRNAADATLDAVYDATALPLRVRSLLGGATPNGDVEATLVVEVGSLKGEDPGTLDVSVEARLATGGRALRGRYATELSSEAGAALTNVGLKLQPGVWQARIVVNEASTGRTGSVLHTFDVSPGAGLRVSTPFVSDELVDGVSPRLRVDWRYPADGPVFCGFAVWNADSGKQAGAARITAHYVLSREGAVVQEAEPVLAPVGAAMLWGRATFAAGSLVPGRYALRIDATDATNGQSHAVEEAFEVTVPAELP
jgi:VWFA-related protein